MPTSIRAISNARRERGFTLIELSLILLILGILLSFAVPRLLEIGTARLDASARQLGSTISYLHDEASLRGRTYRLRLDIDRSSYSIQTQSENADPRSPEAFRDDWDPLAEPTTLPDDVSFDEIELPSGTNSSGTADVFFTPEGDLAEFRIRLINDNGRALEVTVEGVTGRVRILDEFAEYADDRP